MAKSRSRGVEDPALADYGRRRDFSRTPEPAAEIAGERNAARRFVVHLHDARRRHFDLRLEIAGVLKCWAVTRGPSANPAARRLAVRTEDHPIAYLDFEALIPKGSYGAGPMLIWDRGMWTGPADDAALRSLAEGQLKIRLAGDRMRGGWSLVRISQAGERENWLLIKERDQHAEADDRLAERELTSIASGRTLEEIAAGKTSGSRKRADRAPGFIAPMLCTADSRVPRGEDWLFEMKYDGYRMQLARSGSAVAIRTRNGHDWIARFPAIAMAARALGERTVVLDGEIVAFDANGISSFAALKSKLSQGDDDGLLLVAFDVLRAGATDLRGRPLRERKRRLARILADVGNSGAIRLAAYVTGDGEALMREVELAGGEGVIAKRADSLYRSARSQSWRKIKVTATAEVVVVGFTKSEKGQPFAALLVAEKVAGELRYVGRIGTGFSAPIARRLEALMRPLRRVKAPRKLSFVEKAPRRGVVWLQPHIVIGVLSNGRTADGMLRGARLVDVCRHRARNDSASTRAAKAPVRAPSPSRSRPTEETVTLTNPERVVFLDLAVTKRDVAVYYQRVTERMLPHLEDRPVSVMRAPDGIGAEMFFQRHPMPAMRRGIRRMADPEGKHRDYMIIDGGAGLQTMVQFGGLELHGWGARSDAIDRPDRLVLDLDPAPDVAFAEVKSAAQLLRKVLASAALASFALLTGGKGVHVVVPLDRSQPWSEVEAFAAGLARKLAALEPDRFVATMSKRRRTGRIFIDWLRNKRSATAIVPYSLRARAGASVAMPLDWSVLQIVESPGAYGIGSEEVFRARPWRRFFCVRQSLKAAAIALVG